MSGGNGQAERARRCAMRPVPDGVGKERPGRRARPGDRAVAGDGTPWSEDVTTR
jgi:hypothetical protein